MGMGLSISHTFYCIRCKTAIEKPNPAMMCEKCTNVMMRQNSHIIRFYNISNRRLAAIWETYRD